MNLGSRGVINYMPEENNNIVTFDDALSILTNVSKDFFVADAWVPSLNRMVKVQEITAKQQKCLIESAIDSAVKKSTFSKYFYEIVSSNCLEEKSIIDKFTIADKISIAFSMRSQISNEIKVTFQEEPTKIEETIELDKILNKFTEYLHPEPEVVIFSKNSVNIEAIIELPFFSEEFKFDTYIYGNDKNADQAEEIKNIIAGAFLGETAKFIREIKINDKVLEYNSLHIPQKIRFVEKLPAALVQNILEKIIKWKSDLDKISTVTHEDISKNIEVDSLLFLAS